MRQLADFNPSGKEDSAPNVLLPNEHEARERGTSWRLTTDEDDGSLPLGVSPYDVSSSDYAMPPGLTAGALADMLDDPGEEDSLGVQLGRLPSACGMSSTTLPPHPTERSQAARGGASMGAGRSERDREGGGSRQTSVEESAGDGLGAIKREELDAATERDGAGEGGDSREGTSSGDAVAGNGESSPRQPPSGGGSGEASGEAMAAPAAAEASGAEGEKSPGETDGLSAEGADEMGSLRDIGLLRRDVSLGKCSKVPWVSVVGPHG